MKRRTLISFLFAFILMQTGYCQDDDFGLWYGLNAEYQINKKIEIDLSAILRTYNKASKIDQAFLEGGISYKFNKYLSVGGSYRYSDKNEGSAGFYARHKLFADIKGTLPKGNFSLSLRLRYQYQKRTLIERLSDEIPDYHGRIKLKAAYNIPAFPLNPYLYVETFSRLFAESDHFIDKDRFAAGIECKITRKQSIEAEYIFQRDFEPHLSDINVVSINYNIKF
jgi:hypothetical protein